MRNNRAAEDIIDAQNRERQERLASKSSFLKSLAFDIESEAKDHNRLLDNVDGDFDRFVLHVQRNGKMKILVMKIKVEVKLGFKLDVFDLKKPKLCNQVPSLSLSRWRTITLLKI